MARSARKRRDRFLQRQSGLIKALTKHGLFPADTEARNALERLNPYALQAGALAGARCSTSANGAASSPTVRPSEKRTARKA